MSSSPILFYLLASPKKTNKQTNRKNVGPNIDAQIFYIDLLTFP